MGKDEVKVDSERTNEKGCPILATGGTCELRGKVMAGIAVVNRTARERSIQAPDNDVIITSGFGPRLSVTHPDGNGTMMVEKAFRLHDKCSCGRFLGSYVDRGRGRSVLGKGCCCLRNSFLDALCSSFSQHGDTFFDMPLVSFW